MKYMFFSIAVCLITLSCKKDSLDIASFWQCASSQNLDSTAISNKIAGSWKWTKQYCFSAGKTMRADKDIKVTFNTNGTFTVLENSTIITQGNWTLKVVDSNLWELDVTAPSTYLYGRILICNNQVLFNDSYRDGCDNLFEKVN
jgi:hypothetical protein